MNNTQRHKFVFLCGLHRSGTSPLFRILRDHPEISGFRDTGVPEDEGQHLQTVVPAAKFFGGPGQFGFAPKARMTENSYLADARGRERLFREWSRHWDLRRPFLLEKSPPNLIRTRFLQALFHESYFIVIIRHPIAVSLATAKWTDATLDRLIEHWVHCHKIFESDRPHLRNVLLVKYEDLMLNTELQLERIYRFIGVPAKGAASLDPAVNQWYLDTWKIRYEENKTYFDAIIAKYQNEVQRYGYSFVHEQDAVMPYLVAEKM